MLSYIVRYKNIRYNLQVWDGSRKERHKLAKGQLYMKPLCYRFIYVVMLSFYEIIPLSVI